MGSQQDPWIIRHPRWVVFLVGLGLAGCTYLIFGLPAWRLTQLRISGQYTLPVAELQAITQAQQHGRWLLFFRQTNLWAFDTRAYERRLRERWMFSQLTIKRSLPNAIALTLVEEQPAFVYKLNDQVVGIDRSGVASTVLPTAPSGIPELVFLEPPVLTLGAAALTQSQSRFLNAFMGKLQERHDRDITVVKVTVAVAPDTTLRLAMAGEWEVIVNAAADGAAQAEALLLAYDQKLKGRDIEYVDVSVPARIYVK